MALAQTVTALDVEGLLLTYLIMIIGDMYCMIPLYHVALVQTATALDVEGLFLTYLIIGDM